MPTRRTALQLLGAAAAAVTLPRAQAQSEATPAIAAGPFQPTRDSLAAYRLPAWFGEAKFGIWSHWGPQSGIEDGDWYARNMYIQGSAQYQYQLRTYGHPSKIGYKDLVPLFKAARWDPGHLMDLYVKAGAKYFFSMGVHHDNFDLWNSKYQRRWNAVTTGPRRDIVGLWAQAARRRGLRFGVSEHLSNSFDWFAPAHTSDRTGPLAGVAYDGVLPAYADLYHDYSGMPAGFTRTSQAMGRVAPERWRRQYFNRIKDLIDQHHPDVLYTDGGIPFGNYGLSLVAHLYNSDAARHGGTVEAVYTSKTPSDCAAGTCALDHERSVTDGIAAQPFQTDTCIGDWHYKRGIKYKSAKTVVDLLVDIVSKNGNLLLNFPLPNSGELDPEEMIVLNDLTAWMRVNSEGIYATRPWTVYGEGPSTKVAVTGAFNESRRPVLTAADVRFTRKGDVLYAFVQGWPGADVVIAALGSASPQRPPKITGVELLGQSSHLKFAQEAAGLRITLPPRRPATAGIGIAFRLHTS